ncbi:NUDIX domain-containing protein [Saccharopolyspora erythraea]|uniref:ADP-ribose pyrophosphatase n=1 Tax=Saccharopolyspora erythraea (strain ATCC 11635 / DSM 40517 / JCM 4748 / NBRC 13426 / NCIMB 8594 / NRRL 2338) TaxID=405948 RepID=A4FKA8_SACEN|nr:NUDIX hydrolase [Saccharopolyspora erythraea]EQD83027.1 ADP-ribose pyrophosphatase [Saccharopolyspora erythraea D]QRK88227.1 NUDIX hydrolase [Saccharopolyspora erythraea]CAM04483.1 ADP-ribose pyrophosphatase [Saccharopolyspora erythraea NRRL 2338]
MSTSDAADAGGIKRTNGEHEFTTLDSSDVYVGKILALRKDEVSMPGGGRARREVVEHLGAVAVVAVDAYDQVVLIHQYRYPLGRRLWELPAGLLDVAGEDPQRTAQRELVEEVGLAADDWSVLVDIASSPGFTDQSERVFLARGLSEVERPDAVGDEEADLVIRRFPLEEAIRMVFAGEIVNAPAVSGLIAAQAVLDGRAEARPADAPWRDRPRRLAARDER